MSKQKILHFDHPYYHKYQKDLKDKSRVSHLFHKNMDAERAERIRLRTKNQ